MLNSGGQKKKLSKVSVPTRKCVHAFPLQQMDEEKAGVEDLLRRGEELMQQTPDESQREEIRLLLVRLQSQYSAHRVRCFKDSLFFRGSCLGMLFLFYFFLF